MKSFSITIIFISMILCLLNSQASEKYSISKEQTKIIELIEFSISKGVPQFNRGNYDACEAIYTSSLMAISELGYAHLGKETLAEINETLLNVKGINNSEKNSWSLRKSLDKVYSSIKIKDDNKEMKIKDPKIILEAKLPKGFPKPGPVSDIVVKDYPVYRAAKFENSNGQNMAFMRLFSHIKTNNIAMTAPVEMNLNQNAERIDMAFLYQNTALGKTGDANGGVKVLDLPAQKYLSIGVLGRETKTTVKSAVEKLEKWLNNQSNLKAVGKPRLLGYNSPMVPADRRFWEVQIPVENVN